MRPVFRGAAGHAKPLSPFEMETDDHDSAHQVRFWLLAFMQRRRVPHDRAARHAAAAAVGSGEGKKKLSLSLLS